MIKLFTTTYNRALLLMAAVACCVLSLHAFPKESYAEQSRMASGKWVKIKVAECGMQYLSNSFLKNQGFSDPSKVNVYGYGGRTVSEALSASLPDDLPLQPVVRTADGILFYGVDNVSWTASTAGSTYVHEQNPYSTESYYFLSDIAVEETEMEKLGFQDEDKVTATSFTRRLFHEKEAFAPSNTGRVLLGEDFRTLTSQSFSFQLPGVVADTEALATVRFATKTSTAGSSIMLTANGSRLPSTTADNLAAVSSSEMFMRLTSTSKKVPYGGDKLTLDIKYVPGGTVAMARLDYIEVEYQSAIALENGDIHFYDTYRQPTCVKVEGCSQSTRIWDVTDPAVPKEVEYRLQGSTALFGVNDTRYHEYVAFDESCRKRTPTAVKKVSNQDIHSLPVPDMLIICPSEYVSEAERLADMHRQVDGMLVHVLAPELIYNEFSSGTPDIGGFRKCLKMWYDRGTSDEGHRLQHVLVYSRPTYDNRLLSETVSRQKYPRVPIWQSADGVTHNTSYSTDAILAMLEDCPEGEFDIALGRLCIGVGRLPVKSLQEAADATDKIINYVRNPEYGSWRNNVMIIADDQDSNVHFNQAERCYSAMRAKGNGSSFLYNRLYLDAYPLESTSSGLIYTLPRQKLQDAFNDGVMYIDYIGHASPRGWGHEGLLNWTDMTTMSNTRLPIIYAATCEFARWDDDAVSGGEEMWLYPEAGVIAFITASRTVYISQNGELNLATSKILFERDEEGRGKTLGRIFMEGMNGMNRRDDNKLRYILMGDPAMRLPSPSLQVVAESIDDQDMATATGADAPVIQAGSRAVVKGTIRNTDGTVADGFNGVVTPVLYDAEQVVETLGNGDEGQSVAYNDHKTRLFIGSAKVEAGQWEAVITMPLEISNTFNPALLSMYAYSQDGQEANGTTTNLYVFGFNDAEITDTEGPVISDFYVNTPSFADGDKISGSALVYARLSDESGINLSDAGIGHQLMLTIDGKTHFSDVAQYYEPDPETPGTGSIRYLITGVEPGEHTLTLTAWDNMNNSSSSDLAFVCAPNQAPNLYTVTTDVNPASTSVKFLISHDRPGQQLSSSVEVFDLSGRCVWSSATSKASGKDSALSIGWDLRDASGMRVPRGIYIYRAVVETADGRTATKSSKLAVTAP